MGEGLCTHYTQGCVDVCECVFVNVYRGCCTLRLGLHVDVRVSVAG